MNEPGQRLAGEVVFIVLLLTISAFMLWTSYMISGFSSPSSPGSFPLAASFTMVVSGLVILSNTLRAKAAEPLPGQSLLGTFLRQLTPTIIVTFVLAVLGYMLILEQLGFVLSSFLYLLVGMRLLGSRNLKTNLFAATVALAGIYIVFKTAFSVVLPQGDVLKALVAGTPLDGWLP